MKVIHLRGRRSICQLAVLLTLFCVVSLLLPACEAGETIVLEEGEATLSLSSLAFHDGQNIPAKYSCEGENVSPPLTWNEPPAGTQSFVLIVDDPDAPIGVFTHWVLFNIPSGSRELPEAVPTQGELPSGALQGKNGFKRLGYGGPCPPRGGPHRYRFILYALDKRLDLTAGVSRQQVLGAMQGHILARGQLTGTYQR